MTKTMRGVLVGLGLAAVAVGGVVAGVVSSRSGPPAVFATSGFGDLDPRQKRWIRLEGTAHYPATLTQNLDATMFREERTYYVFAFFPVHDTSSREIPLLVRTQRPPERLVSYETMTIEGRLGPLTERTVPSGSEKLLGEKVGYFFAEPVYLLEPVRIVSEDGIWEEPGWK